jgi:hypothetical protein
MYAHVFKTASFLEVFIQNFVSFMSLTCFHTIPDVIIYEYSDG